MAIFHCYVSSPEDIHCSGCGFAAIFGRHRHQQVDGRPVCRRPVDVWRPSPFFKGQRLEFHGDFMVISWGISGKIQNPCLVQVVGIHQETVGDFMPKAMGKTRMGRWWIARHLNFQNALGRRSWNVMDGGGQRQILESLGWVCGHACCHLTTVDSHFYCRLVQ